MNYIKDTELQEEVSKVSDYVKETRHYLHAHPEIGLKEYNTCQFIRNELDKMGIKWKEASETGTIGIIEGSDGDNVLALRADIDALKVKEEVDVDFKSENDGLMHACGHDAHTATLLAAAKILKEKYEHKFDGKIYLLFQPGEETTMGAKNVIKSKAVNDVKAFYGQHVWIDTPIGKIMTKSNSFMTGARIFEIEVTGVSGHGSMLEKTANPIVAASNIVVSLQSIVSNNISSQDTAVVCVGGIEGGGQSNAVPDKCRIIGTTRFSSKAIEETLNRRIEEISESIAKAYNCHSEVTYLGSISALCTDPDLTNIANKAYEKVVGQENVVNGSLIMGSEDFAEYCDISKVAFGFIGCRNDEIMANKSHHSSLFKIDEDCLDICVAGFISYTKEYFNL